ncbi:MAG: MoaD/ThiS family protein [Candidatus Hodarchaeota archaeon]
MEKSTLSEDLFESQQYKEIVVTETRTVADLLQELKLEDAYLAVLVDGEKADLKDELKEGQKIIILPKIAGG